MHGDEEYCPKVVIKSTKCGGGGAWTCGEQCGEIIILSSSYYYYYCVSIIIFAMFGVGTLEPGYLCSSQGREV